MHRIRAKYLIYNTFGVNSNFNWPNLGEAYTISKTHFNKL